MVSLSDDFHDLCRRQVIADNQKFGIDSRYLPNTVYTLQPGYCLVAMEPSLSAKSTHEFQTLIDRGFTNFLYSHGDFILQYCAYKVLCDHSFDFALTDLSRGAMKIKIAANNKLQRRKDWLPIFKKEYAIFGEPRLIAVGREVEKFLTDNGFKAEYVMHYSSQNSVRFKKHHANYLNQDVDSLDHHLKSFVELAFETINYPEELRTQTLTRLFRKKLSLSKLGMYHYYADRFKEIRLL